MKRLVPRLALSPDEAAESLGVSRSHFYKYIWPDLRVVRVGTRTLIPVHVLEAWLDQEAARTLGTAVL
jgi:excisionase family DNA binding protein